MTKSPMFAYNAFVSYSTRADYMHARHIEAFLESVHQVASAHNENTVGKLQICRDGSDFRLPQRREKNDDPDDTIWHIIQSALGKCEYLLVLCCPESAQSKWVGREITWFVEHRGVQSILLAVTKGNPNDRPDSVFHASLRDVQRQNTSIWYDLRAYGTRPNTDQYRNYEDEILRLAADLLNWDPQANEPLAPVWRRTRARSRRKSVLALIGILLVVTGLSGWGIRTHITNARLEIQSAFDGSIADRETDDNGTKIVFYTMDDPRLLGHLLSIPNLYHLDLEDTDTNDLHVPILRRCSGVRELLLARTDVTDLGIRLLTPLPNLRSLTLANTKVGDWSMCAISTGRLEILDISNTLVTSNGLLYLRNAQSLRQLTIKNLAQISGGMRHVAMLKDLTFLDLSGSPIIDSDLQQLANLPLRGLVLDNTNITDDGLQHLAMLEKLEELHLDGNQLKGTKLGGLAVLKQLRKLYLTNNQIGNDGIAQIAQIKSLKVIVLMNNPVTDEGSGELATLPHLYSLNLSGTNITDVGVAALLPLRDLHDLYLGDLQRVTDRSLEFLQELPRLQVLHMPNTNVTDEGLQFVNDTGSIRKLILDDTKVTNEGIQDLQGRFPNISIDW